MPRSAHQHKHHITTTTAMTFDIQNPLKEVPLLPKLLMLGIFTFQGFAFLIWLRYLRKELQGDLLRKKKD
jgi:hypothetical protein